MLPILRILPVGGLLLAILILVLALSPPDGSRAPLSSAILPSRGAPFDPERQAEVRPYIIHAPPPSSAPMSSIVCASFPTHRRDPTMFNRQWPAFPATEAKPIRKSRHQSTKHRSSAFQWRLVNLPRPNCPSLRRGKARWQQKKPNLPPNRNGNPAASTEYAVSEHRRTRRHLARSIFWKRCSAGRSVSNPRTVASRLSSDINRCQTSPRRRTRTPFPRSLAPIPTRRLGQRKIAMSDRARRK